MSSPDPKDTWEQVTVCEGCEEPIRQISAGDESWDYCDGCEHVVEGHTKSMWMDEDGNKRSEEP